MLAQTAHIDGMTSDFLFNVQSGYLKGFELYRNFGIQNECSSIYQNSHQEDISFEPVQEKTDLQIRVDTETNNTEARGSYHLLIVDNDKLELSRIEKFD